MTAVARTSQRRSRRRRAAADRPGARRVRSTATTACDSRRAIEALVAAATERLADDDPLWRLADRIGRLRAADPDDVELAVDWLDALLARTERARHGRVATAA